MYQRKTKYVWCVQGLYVHGWETVYECDTLEEARRVYNDYIENDLGYAYRIKKVREKR